MGINIPSRGDLNHVVALPYPHCAPARAHRLLHRLLAHPRHHPPHFPGMGDVEVRPLGGGSSSCLAEPAPELVGHDRGPLVGSEHCSGDPGDDRACNHRSHRCSHRMHHGEDRTVVHVGFDLPGVQQGSPDGGYARVGTRQLHPRLQRELGRI